MNTMRPTGELQTAFLRIKREIAHAYITVSLQYCDSSPLHCTVMMDYDSCMEFIQVSADIIVFDNTIE